MGARPLTAIDVIETAYDLHAGPAEWLPNLMDATRGLLDHGMGMAGSVIAGLADGIPTLTRAHFAEGSDELIARYFDATQESGAELVARVTAAMQGKVIVLSQMPPGLQRLYEIFTRHLRCKDVVGFQATDPDFHGSTVQVFCNRVMDLTPQELERWSRVAVHVTAGHRVRRGLYPDDAEDTPALTAMDIHSPEQAEAILDPRRFRVSNAAGAAKGNTPLKQIREAAIRLDRARGRLRRTEPDEALGIWQGLVQGRWSLVDWFDTDGRRFVLAKPNAPDLGDPRGLTERELQVATYAARGESGKSIGYRFGFSASRVSTLLKSAMRKLGAKTQAQLVDKMRTMPQEPHTLTNPPH